MNAQMLCPVIAATCFLFAAAGSSIASLRFLRSTSFLPYHEQAAGIKWADVPAPIQFLILTLMRVSGLGGAVVAGIAFFTSGSCLFENQRILDSILGIGIATYWFGMFCITTGVHKKTNADTPYRLSFVVFLVSLIGVIALLI